MAEVTPYGDAAAPDVRGPAEIEADIARGRESLAATLDEIAMRVHPKTLADDAKAKVSRGVQDGVDKVKGTVGRVVDTGRSALTTEDGSPRLERVIPLAVVGVAVAAVVVSRRRR